MFSRRLALLSLLVIPSVSLAQRGVRGEKRADWDKIESTKDGGSGTVRLSSRDVEALSPLKTLIDERKELKLSEAQLTQIRELEGSLKETTKPSFSVLDSLLKELKSKDMSDAARVRRSLARADMMTVLASIRVQYDSGFHKAIPLLDENQKVKAGELVEKQRQDAEDDIRQKLGGGRPPRGDGKVPFQRPPR